MILLLWIFLCAQNTYCRYNWKVVHTNNQLNSSDLSDQAIDKPKADHGKNPPKVEAEDGEEALTNYIDMKAKDGAKPMGKQNENGPMKFKNGAKPKKKYKDRAKSNEYKYKYEYKDGYKYEYNDGGNPRRKQAKDVVKVKKHMDGSEKYKHDAKPKKHVTRAGKKNLLRKTGTKPQKYKVGFKPNNYKVKSKSKKYYNEANPIKYKVKDGGKPKNHKDGNNVKKYIYQQVNE